VENDLSLQSISSTGSSSNSNSAAAQAMLKKKLWPRPTEPFAGEPHAFHAWVTSLQSRMNGSKLSALDVIHVLQANTVGDPHRVVNEIFFGSTADPKFVLQIIWDKLFDSFGRDDIVAESLIKKVSRVPAIKKRDVDSLRRFLELCSVIKASRQKCKGLELFNFPMFIRLLMSKLPESLREKRRNVGDAHQLKTKTAPSFEHSYEFLESEVSALRNPMFDDLDFYDIFGEKEPST
jgi:hypothetical protein